MLSGRRCGCCRLCSKRIKLCQPKCVVAWSQSVWYFIYLETKKCLWCTLLRKALCSSLDFIHADLPSLNSFLKRVAWSLVNSASGASVAVSSWESILASRVDGKVHDPIQKLCSISTAKQTLVQLLPESFPVEKKSFSRSKLLERGHQLFADRKLRNLYVAELRFAERQHYKNQISALYRRLIYDPHRGWKTAKTACGIQVQSFDSTPSLSQDGCIKGTPEEKANCLNSVFTALCSAAPSSTKPRLPPNCTLAESFLFAHLSNPQR